MTAAPEDHAQFRDAVALSLHTLRGDDDAVLEMLANAEEAGTGHLVGLIMALLHLGNAVGQRLGPAYTVLLAQCAARASLAAEGIAP